MKVTKLGKPVCLSSPDGYHRCCRVGIWRFEYRSFGKLQYAYYCDECAARLGYQVFRQVLVKEG